MSKIKYEPVLKDNKPINKKGQFWTNKEKEEEKLYYLDKCNLLPYSKDKGINIPDPAGKPANWHIVNNYGKNNLTGLVGICKKPFF